MPEAILKALAFENRLKAVRGLLYTWPTPPDLDVKPLLAKLRVQQPNLGAGTRGVREALKALEAENEAAAAAAPAAAADIAAPLAANEGDDLLNALSHDRLSALPLELQLLVADAVGDRCDRAALALASPRLLGLAACRKLSSYQGLEMSLAFHHVLGRPIDEQLLRSYASRSKSRYTSRSEQATLEGCEWLAGVAAAGLWIRVAIRTLVPTSYSWSLRTSNPFFESILDTARSEWYLMRPGSTVGALLRDEKPHEKPHMRTYHYDGGEGAERLVRIEAPTSGKVLYYEGEWGAERLVRCELPGGEELHYEGEKGAGRVVRQVFLDGHVLHFDGAGRRVRLELPGGEVSHYKGEKCFDSCCLAVIRTSVLYVG